MRVDDDASVSAPGLPNEVPAASSPEAADAPASAARSPGRAGRAGAAVRRRLTPEHLLVLVLGLLVLAEHDVHYLLTHSFWTDESWVAVITKFPLSKLPATTSSTPIGWSELMRLVTIGGTEVSRLLPLAFAGGTVVVAYWLGRGLGWRGRPVAVAAGVLASVAVLLVPAILVRDDLKQYTADACMTLLVLATASRLEREWSRGRLAALSVAVWGGMLVSDAVAFIGIAAFAAVCLIQLARRQWHRLAEAVVAGAITAVLMAAIYKAFVARAVLPGLTYSPHFRYYYFPLTHGWHAAATFITQHFDGVHEYFGLGPWWLAVPLFIAGLVTIFRVGRPATAVTLAVLYPEMLALSAAHKYPFLDQRTSTFVFALTAVTAAIGVAGVCAALRPWLKGSVAAVLAAAAVAAFVVGTHPYARSHRIPAEDVRDQTRYVAAHAAPGDVILVNLSGNWGFAYYWPVGRPAMRTDTAVLQEYEAYFPGQPPIVVARDRDQAGVSAALAQAVARTRAHGGACTRIWLVRIHVNSAERAAWRVALRQDGLSSARVGHAGLSVVQAGGPQCGA